jgi:hypothetical protein
MLGAPVQGRLTHVVGRKSSDEDVEALRCGTDAHEQGNLNEYQDQ